MKGAKSMATVLSWTFLILSPISLIVILIRSIQKSDNKLKGIFFGSLWGGLCAVTCFVISAFIGMNFY